MNINQETVAQRWKVRGNVNPIRCIAAKIVLVVLFKKHIPQITKTFLMDKYERKIFLRTLAWNIVFWGSLVLGMLLATNINK